MTPLFPFGTRWYTSSYFSPDLDNCRCQEAASLKQVAHPIVLCAQTTLHVIQMTALRKLVSTQLAVILHFRAYGAIFRSYALKEETITPKNRKGAHLRPGYTLIIIISLSLNTTIPWWLMLRHSWAVFTWHCIRAVVQVRVHSVRQSEWAYAAGVGVGVTCSHSKQRGNRCRITHLHDTRSKQHIQMITGRCKVTRLRFYLSSCAWRITFTEKWINSEMQGQRGPSCCNPLTCLAWHICKLGLLLLTKIQKLLDGERRWRKLGVIIDFGVCVFQKRHEDSHVESLMMLSGRERLNEIQPKHHFKPGDADRHAADRTLCLESTCVPVRSPPRDTRRRAK